MGRVVRKVMQCTVHCSEAECIDSKNLRFLVQSLYRTRTNKWRSLYSKIISSALRLSKDYSKPGWQTQGGFL